MSESVVAAALFARQYSYIHGSGLIMEYGNAVAAVVVSIFEYTATPTATTTQLRNELHYYHTANYHWII